MRGKGTKLGEGCPKVRLSQDRMTIFGIRDYYVLDYYILDYYIREKFVASKKFFWFQG